MRIVLSAAGVIGAVLAAQPAQACGGFFCSRQTPVAQAGEDILFAQDGDEVIAHVRILYAGKAHEFAWIVPVPSEPTLGTGTDELFAQLNARTLPAFSTTVDFSEQCSGAASLSANEDGGSGDGVDVTFRGAVGPYDAAVLSSASADAVRTWLTDNGYDLPDEALAVIDPYVAQGDYFVALKLLSDRDVGDLLPITLRFSEAPGPCIPIRLTAISSQPNMTIRAWVLGSARAIPTNYKHVLVDLAKIDWECGASNYTDVVTAAANEGGGQAFVTEYAGTTDIMDGAVYDDARFTDALTQIGAASYALEVLQLILDTGLPRSNAMINTLAPFIPAPKGGDEADAAAFVESLFTDCYSWCGDAKCKEPLFECPGLFKNGKYLGALAVDGTAVAAAIEGMVVPALREAQELLDAYPMMTIFFTTLSPEEMTLDPLFGFNPDLPEVSRAHQAAVTRLCDTDGAEYFRVELPDGREIYIDGQDQACAPPDMNAPAGTVAHLRAVLPGSEAGEELGEVGVGRQLYSNSAVIDDLIAQHNAATGFNSGCGCSVGARTKSDLGMAALLALGAALWLTRRRRSARQDKENPNQ